MRIAAILPRAARLPRAACLPKAARSASGGTSSVRIPPADFGWKNAAEMRPGSATPRSIWRRPWARSRSDSAATSSQPKPQWCRPRAEALQVFPGAGFLHGRNQHLDAGLAFANLKHVVVGPFRREVRAVGQRRRTLVQGGSRGASRASPSPPRWCVRRHRCDPA